MTQIEVKALALRLMQQHGLLDLDWRFGFDNARRRLGYCSHTRKKISISQNYVPLLDLNEITDLVLHEIAHGLTGRKHGHDNVWKQKAVEIGCNGDRLYQGEARVKRKYKGTCPKCGKVIYRHLRKMISCGRCDKNFNRDLLFIWTLNDDEE